MMRSFSCSCAVNQFPIQDVFGDPSVWNATKTTEPVQMVLLEQDVYVWHLNSVEGIDVGDLVIPLDVQDTS